MDRALCRLIISTDFIYFSVSSNKTKQILMFSYYFKQDFIHMIN